MSDAVVEYRLAEAGASSKHAKKERGGSARSPPKELLRKEGGSSSLAKGSSPTGKKGGLVYKEVKNV